MGNLFRIIALLIVTIMVSLGISAQESSKSSETKRHIKLLRIVDGKKLELDTTVYNNDPFVWKGDTISGKSTWTITKSGKGSKPHMEESESVYEYKVTGDKNGKKMVFISSDGESPVELNDLGEKTDSVKRIIIRSHSGKGNDAKIMMWDNDSKSEIYDIPVPPIPPVPPVPSVNRLYHFNNSNIIDLSDPGIISYKKKKMKDGTEKIEIVREQLKEGEAFGIGAFSNTPGHTGSLKVIKEGVGPAIIIHGGNSAGEVKVEKIVKDGKVIQIEEINTDNGQKDVNVKVVEGKPIKVEKK